MESSGHAPVLMTQTLGLLSPKPGDCMLDCTVGRGGHASEIVPLLGADGAYYAMDLDAENLRYASARIRESAGNDSFDIQTYHGNFSEADRWLYKSKLRRPNLLLADLGFASNQMDDAERGFSFQHDAPLDMRLNPEQALTAADIIVRYSEKDLADLIYQYGEERSSRKIARFIVENRRKKPIRSTRELADICARAYGGRGGQRSKIHPATRTFMALRIAVNTELENLDRLLLDLPKLLPQGGIAAIISFHSLEDRRVKQAFRAFKDADQGEILTKKPLVADDEENRANPRARSAKIRAIRLKNIST